MNITTTIALYDRYSVVCDGALRRTLIYALLYRVLVALGRLSTRFNSGGSGGYRSRCFRYSDV